MREFHPVSSSIGPSTQNSLRSSSAMIKQKPLGGPKDDLGILLSVRCRGRVEQRGEQFIAPIARVVQEQLERLALGFAGLLHQHRFIARGIEQRSYSGKHHILATTGFIWTG
jgi:hypothetical protein